jgi:hypothetical protein
MSTRRSGLPCAQIAAGKPTVPAIRAAMPAVTGCAGVPTTGMFRGGLSARDCGKACDQRWAPGPKVERPSQESRGPMPEGPDGAGPGRLTHRPEPGPCLHRILATHGARGPGRRPRKEGPPPKQITPPGRRGTPRGSRARPATSPRRAGRPRASRPRPRTCRSPRRPAASPAPSRRPRRRAWRPRRPRRCASRPGRPNSGGNQLS